MKNLDEFAAGISQHVETVLNKHGRLPAGVKVRNVVSCLYMGLDSRRTAKRVSDPKSRDAALENVRHAIVKARAAGVDTRGLEAALRHAKIWEGAMRRRKPASKGGRPKAQWQDLALTRLRGLGLSAGLAKELIAAAGLTGKTPVRRTRAE